MGREVNLRSLSWRRVKKEAKKFLNSYHPPLKILKRDSHTWYVTPHPNMWCVRYWNITIFNADKLKDGIAVNDTK